MKRRRLALPERDIEIALLDFGGDGPPLLAHHANGFCAALWAPVAEPLRERFHVLAMDARGHGDSQKPPAPGAYAWTDFVADVGAVADHLAEEHGRPVALGLGHSFGGTSILAAEAARPGRFERVACVDPVIFPPSAARTPERAERSKLMVDGALNRRRHFGDRAEALAHFRARSLFADWPPRALELYVDEGLAVGADGRLTLKCPPEVEATVFQGPRDFDVFAAVRGLATPTLLLWARLGNFPRAVYEALVEPMLDATIEDVDAGHLMTMTCPERVAEAVLGFVRRDEPQRSTG